MHLLQFVWRFVWIWLALAGASLAARLLKPPASSRPRPNDNSEAGISVVVPERGTPETLAETLGALQTALGRIDETTQVIIVVNGASRSLYTDLLGRFADFEWHFNTEALAFNDAILAGMKHVRLEWTYLLNSDMRLDPFALRELLVHRHDDVFALASQIFFVDTNRRREETGWTDYVDNPHQVEIYDRLPEPDSGVRAGLYAGGGASLFRSHLLRRYAAGAVDYAPFYIEDADWGTHAWQDGWKTLFCPTSIAWHHHRATIGKFYASNEVDRIVRRNHLLFDLRNAWTALNRKQQIRRVLDQDETTQMDLTGIAMLWRTLRSRAQALRARRQDFSFHEALQNESPFASGERLGSDLLHQDAKSTDILSARIAPLPRILWIELTSRCPFDCIFCSRKLLRGAGTHIDFALYTRLIGELQSPDIIRLNYSGESAHYPKIVEATALAAGTGARVELVTTLAALPEHKLAGLVHAGLTRLTISLHTLDTQQFTEIYKFSSLQTMTNRIEAAIDLAKTAPRALEIDFAFVVMQRNLAQLHEVAAYAQRLGITRLAVHPVIRRDPIEETFDDELDDGRLRKNFIAAINSTIEAVRIGYPNLTVESSTPELEEQVHLSHEPRYFPGLIPQGAIIHACDQDPWETIHILADGGVVTCEQRDRIVLGNLHSNSLVEIWRGSNYSRFRDDYVAARDAHCNSCPYKKVSLPSAPPNRYAAPGTGRTSLLDGWFADDDQAIAWSRPLSKLRLAGQGHGQLKIHGYLPAGGHGKNRLDIRLNGRAIAVIVNNANELKEFVVNQPVEVTGSLQIEFETAVDYCPIERGDTKDSRRLGFALAEASFSEATPVNAG